MVVSISIFAIVIGIGMLTYFAINKLHINKINKIAMSDVLKDRE